jgi:signal peptidase I
MRSRRPPARLGSARRPAAGEPSLRRPVGGGHHRGVQPTRGRILAAAAFVAAAGLAALRPRRVEVVGESMLPTLLPGDRLLTLRLPVPVGAVVAAADPRDPARTLLKRVAAGPGGRLLLPGGRRLEAGGGYLLLGDNPAASTDSADFGPVPARSLRGRAVYRYAPPHRRGVVPRPARGADADQSHGGKIAERPVGATADHQEE